MQRDRAEQDDECRRAREQAGGDPDAEQPAPVVAVIVVVVVVMAVLVAVAVVMVPAAARTGEEDGTADGDHEQAGGQRQPGIQRLGDDEAARAGG